jgi:hypothetical protein
MNRIVAWIIALFVPVAALAVQPTSATTPTTTQAAAGNGQPAADASVAASGRRCQVAGGCAGTQGYFGGRGRGNGGPPYGAGYEARRPGQGGGPGSGRGMGRYGGRGAGCGR